MGSDFEINDSCPKCGSSKVDSRWDEFGLVRIFLHCKNCLHIEVINQYVEHTHEGELLPWQSDPDAWKNQ